MGRANFLQAAIDIVGLATVALNEELSQGFLPSISRKSRAATREDPQCSVRAEAIQFPDTRREDPRNTGQTASGLNGCINFIQPAYKGHCVCRSRKQETLTSVSKCLTGRGSRTAPSWKIACLESGNTRRQALPAYRWEDRTNPRSEDIANPGPARKLRRRARRHSAPHDRRRGRIAAGSGARSWAAGARSNHHFRPLLRTGEIKVYRTTSEG